MKRFSIKPYLRSRELDFRDRIETRYIYIEYKYALIIHISSMSALSTYSGLSQNNKQILTLFFCTFIASITSLHQSRGAIALKVRECTRSTCARTHARVPRKTNHELLVPPSQHDLINGRARSVDKVRLCRAVRGTGSIKSAESTTVFH